MLAPTNRIEIAPRYNSRSHWCRALRIADQQWLQQDGYHLFYLSSRSKWLIAGISLPKVTHSRPSLSPIITQALPSQHPSKSKTSAVQNARLTRPPSPPRPLRQRLPNRSKRSPQAPCPSREPNRPAHHAEPRHDCFNCSASDHGCCTTRWPAEPIHHQQRRRQGDHCSD